MINIEAKYYEIYDEVSCSDRSSFDHFLVSVGTTTKRKLNSLHEVYSYLNILCDIIYESNKVNIYKYEDLYYKLVYYGNICFKFAIISKEDIFKYVRYLEATADAEIVKIKDNLKKTKKEILTKLKATNKDFEATPKANKVINWLTRESVFEGNL